MGKCCSKFFQKNSRKDSVEEHLNTNEIDRIFQNSTGTKEKSLSTYNNTNSLQGRDKSFISKEISKKDFKIIKTVGRGSFGKVLLVKYHMDERLYAMKILRKDIIRQTNQVFHTKTEREILARVDHEFIVKLKFAFQTNEKLYLVTDFMQGGELFYHLHKEGRFSESKAQFYASEIVLAIDYLHKNQIIYRDLKPENILLDSYGHIKITDFGLSKFIFSYDNYKAYTICGTPEYLAPEILTGNGYDKNVDWWSLGCLIYEMLCGVSPFKFNKESKLEVKLYEKKVECPFYFSEASKRLILNLLQLDPSKRLGSGKMDAEEIKNHEFFAGFDWNEVEKKNVVPPFRPALKSSDDLIYFDKIFTEEDPVDTPSEKAIFPVRSNYDDINNKYGGFTYKASDDINKIINPDSK
jgi:serine/threonine protein kinase